MNRWRIAAAFGAGVLLTGGVSLYAYAAGSAKASCTANPAITEGQTNRSFTVTCSVPRESATTVTATKTVTVSGSPSASVSASQSASASSSATQTATSAPTSSQAFPGESNTGVPAGVALKTYVGPMTITTPTTLDSVRITGRLVVKASLTVTRSLVVGTIDADYGKPVSVTDSEVDGGTSNSPAVGYGDITLKRVNVHGSRVSVLCGSDCVVEDSWLHGQYLQSGSDWHVNGYLSNGGSNVLVRHNTIACEPNDNSNGGGCTGPGAVFGDFASLRNITFDRNLFKAGPGGFCLAAGLNRDKPFGKDPQGVVITSNVFERGRNAKCGAFGPVTSFDGSGVGNRFEGNVWDNGGSVPAG